MSKVIECARALGEAIVASEEYKNMQLTEAAAMADPAVTEAMSRFLELRETLNGLMLESDPDAEKIAKLGEEMDDAQRALNAMPAVDAMTTARQQFSEMMNSVNRVLEFIVAGETQESGGCSGNCSACGGCH